MKRKAVVSFLTLAVVVQFSSCARKVDYGHHFVPLSFQPVSVQRLIDEKDRFDAAVVQTSGFLAHRFENYRLYPTWTDFQRGTENNVRTTFADDMRKELSSLHGARVTIIGVFDASHGDNGAIKIQSATKAKRDRQSN